MILSQMTIQEEFKPIAEAILEHVQNKNPNTVLFVVGKKQYKAKDVKKHILKEDKVANTLIKLALKTNGCNCEIKRGVLLAPEIVSPEQIEATVQMFKSD